MQKHLKKERWSPYLVGTLIGLLSIVSFFLFNKTIGTSTTFVKLAAMLLSIFDPAHVENNLYYQEYLNNKAWIDWQFMLVLGIFLGAFLSKKFSKKETTECTSSQNSKQPYWIPFIGGIIVMFGARFAGGCTSGHAISGGFQLAVSGWLFMGAVFALGIPTALFIHRKKSYR